MTLVRFAGPAWRSAPMQLRAVQARMRRGSRSPSPKGVTQRRRRNSLRRLGAPAGGL